MKNILILLVLAIFTMNYINKQNYVEIPSTSIRLRVIAASNMKKDQENKIIVKNAIVEELNKALNDTKTYDSANNIIENNIDNIKNIISKTLDKNNIDSKFSINYGLNYFPEKTYRGVTYSAGNYQSLVVSLDEGSGENWWCALYPPICQIDDAKDTNEYRILIKDLISQYN